MAITLFMLSLLLVVSLLAGFWATKQQGKIKSPEQMILANRNIPIWLGLFTLTATWVGGGYINGTAEAAYSQGLFYTQAPIGYALALMLGGVFFAKKMREKNYVTLLDPFTKAYGTKITALIYIPALVGELFWTAAILSAIGSTMQVIFGLDPIWAIVLPASIAIAYTLIGGMWAVAITDFVQLIFIAAGLCLALPYIIDGAANLSTLPNKPISLPTNSTQQVQWVDQLLLLILGGIPWGGYFQRVLACQSPNAAKNLSIFAGISCLVLAIPPALIGYVSQTVDFTSLFLGEFQPALVLPLALKFLTPQIIAMIGLIAVTAAVMSSVDSSILSAASMLCWNILKPFHPAFQKHFQLSLKISIASLGVLAINIALNSTSTYDLWYFCSDLVYVLLFPQLVVVLYSKNPSPLGATLGLLIGLVTRISLGIPWFGIPVLISENILSYPIPWKTFCMLSSLSTICVTNYLANRSKQNIYFIINNKTA